jgi:hypothetical protein
MAGAVLGQMEPKGMVTDRRYRYGDPIRCPRFCLCRRDKTGTANESAPGASNRAGINTVYVIHGIELTHNEPLFSGHQLDENSFRFAREFFPI